MATAIPTLIIVGYILYLFYVDRDRTQRVSRCIWIPFVWMFLAAGHFVSGWMSLGTPRDLDASIILEGSPLDRGIFTALIVLGSIIVARRPIDWNSFLNKNRWVVVYFAFGLLSVLWSPYPGVSFKRWIKALGNLIMILVILSEEDPLEGFVFILYRMTFILIPLSWLFIKYYPDFARAYHFGGQMVTGAFSQRNQLGRMCVDSGLIVLWALLCKDHKYRLRGRQPSETVIAYASLCFLIVWNLVQSRSKTSLVTVIVGAVLLIWLRSKAATTEPNKIIGRIVLLSGLGVTLNWLFDITTGIIYALDRDPSLTTRVPMWEALLAAQPLQWLGSGYESYWLGSRLEALWAQFGGLKNAHNGYVETYLNLGLVGLAFLTMFILSGFRNIHQKLQTNYSWGTLSLTIAVVSLFFNWTEAGLHAVSIPWIVFLFSLMELETSHATKTVSVAGRARGS